MQPFFVRARNVEFVAWSESTLGIAAPESAAEFVGLILGR